MQRQFSRRDTGSTLRSQAPVFTRVLCIFLATGLAGCAVIGNHAPLESPGDSKVSIAVHRRLEQSPALDAPNLISIQTLRGVVYLRGLVSTPYQIEEAGRLAAQALGAEHVENLLAVDNAR